MHVYISQIITTYKIKMPGALFPSSNRHRNSAQASFTATKMRQCRSKLRLLGRFRFEGLTRSAIDVFAQSVSVCVCVCVCVSVCTSPNWRLWCVCVYLSQLASLVSFWAVLACICQLSDSCASIWNRHLLHHGVAP